MHQQHSRKRQARVRIGKGWASLPVDVKAGAQEFADARRYSKTEDALIYLIAYALSIISLDEAHRDYEIAHSGAQSATEGRAA